MSDGPTREEIDAAEALVEAVIIAPMVALYAAPGHLDTAEKRAEAVAVYVRLLRKVAHADPELLRRLWREVLTSYTAWVWPTPGHLFATLRAMRPTV